MTDAPMLQCAWCEAFLLEDAATYAQRDGETVCDACLCEYEHFRCCWCEACDTAPAVHPYVVVFDAEAYEVPLPGLYRSASGQVWGHEWVGFLPLVTDPWGEDWGYLCAPCQQQALAHLALYHAHCCAVASY